MKPIEGFTDLFITKSGKIVSNRSGKSKTLKTFFSAKGYECIIVTEKGVRIHLSIHREVAKAYIPNPHNKPEVNHIDGNKARNIDLNLEWMTPKENKKHMYEVLGHSPIRNKRQCVLIAPGNVLHPCETVLEAARFARDEYGQSYSSMCKYRKNQKGFEIVRCRD